MVISGSKEILLKPITSILPPIVIKKPSKNDEARLEIIRMMRTRKNFFIILIIFIKLDQLK